MVTYLVILGGITLDESLLIARHSRHLFFSRPATTAPWHSVTLRRILGTCHALNRGWRSGALLSKATATWHGGLHTARVI